MKTHDCVTFNVLQDIVRSTSKKTGLTAPARSDIANMYYDCKKFSIPLICVRKNGILWVDKYYVAYQLEDSALHYTYIARYHINEEIAGYRAASRLRGEQVELPDDIRREFLKAQRFMADTHENIWVEEFEKK